MVLIKESVPFVPLARSRSDPPIESAFAKRAEKLLGGINSVHPVIPIKKRGREGRDESADTTRHSYFWVAECLGCIFGIIICNSRNRSSIIFFLNFFQVQLSSIQSVKFSGLSSVAVPPFPCPPSSPHLTLCERGREGGKRGSCVDGHHGRTRTAIGIDDA